MAKTFALGEVEIINNPKVKPKRLERTVKFYAGALKAINEENRKKEELKKEQEELDKSIAETRMKKEKVIEIQKRLDELAKNLGSLSTE